MVRIDRKIGNNGQSASQYMGGDAGGGGGTRCHYNNETVPNRFASALYAYKSNTVYAGDQSLSLSWGGGRDATQFLPLFGRAILLFGDGGTLIITRPAIYVYIYLYTYVCVCVYRSTSGT